MVRGCIATPRCRCRRLPPDGSWPLAVTGGISQSELCSCGEQTCLNIYIKLLDFCVMILLYNPGIDVIVHIIIAHKELMCDSKGVGL